MLLHEFPEGQKRVIAYASRKLKGAEHNYGITELECLAIVWAVEKFRIYLLGIRFRIVTDHLALQWLRTKKELTARLMRWALKLEPYDYEVVYKSGKLNKDADFLSRYPVDYLAIEALESPQAGDPQPVCSGDELENRGYVGNGGQPTVANVELPAFDEQMIIEAQQQDEQC